MYNKFATKNFTNRFTNRLKKSSTTRKIYNRMGTGMDYIISDQEYNYLQSCIIIYNKSSWCKNQILLNEP